MERLTPLKFTLPLLALLTIGCSSNEVANAENPPTTSLLVVENKAEAAYHGGHLDISEGYYRQLLDAKPRYSPAWFRLGNIYTRNNRLQAAVNAYQRCLQLDINHEKAWHNLAVARMRQATDVLLSAQAQIGSNSPMSGQLARLLDDIMALQTNYSAKVSNDVAD